VSGPLVTFGEVLAVLRTDQPGPLEHGASMRLSIAGSESNVAIGVRRLGRPAVFIGRVGDDPLGALARTTLQREQVDTRWHIDPTRPTGLMLAEQCVDDVRRVVYYRRGSAASAITPDDLDETVLAAAGLVHITGITPALGASARETVAAAMQSARRANVPISLDLNFRAALCTPAQFRKYVEPLLATADLVFASLDEARLVVDDADSAAPAELATSLRRVGPAEVVLTDGHNGAWADDGTGRYRQPAHPVTVVDTIGAGDAFVAGYLASRLQGAAIEERLRVAARVAACCVATAGDWEGLPSVVELQLLDRAD
jgi:2-dehydro-3-deoxygluconokinase